MSQPEYAHEPHVFDKHLLRKVARDWKLDYKALKTYLRDEGLDITEQLVKAYGRDGESDAIPRKDASTCDFCNLFIDDWYETDCDECHKDKRQCREICCLAVCLECETKKKEEKSKQKPKEEPPAKRQKTK